MLIGIECKNTAGVMADSHRWHWDLDNNVKLNDAGIDSDVDDDRLLNVCPWSELGRLYPEE